MQKLISFTIYAEKGFLKKPDINEGMYLSYNMLHKPAILGILGAIVGLEGYKKNQEFPEYYKLFKDIPIGIKPKNDDKGNFQKTIISYNNTTGLASNEPGGNLIITEQTLIAPAYTIYLLLDLEKKNQKKLYENIKKQEAVYLPYLGKNDYSLWWNKEEVKEYEFEKTNEISKSFKIDTIFNKNELLLKDNIDDEISDELNLLDVSDIPEEDNFMYFERLPVGFDEKLYQYEMADFAFTNFKLNAKSNFKSIYKLAETGFFIQLN